MKENIRELIKALKKIRGESADISISHKLYGKQKLRCIFSPIINERIGFNINEQSIYIDRQNVQRIYLKDYICFADDVMEIKIEV